VVATAGKVITVAASAIPAARTVLRSGPGLAGEGGGLWSRLGGVLSRLPQLPMVIALLSAEAWGRRRADARLVLPHFGHAKLTRPTGSPAEHAAGLRPE
jgi:hypothetical protein